MDPNQLEALEDKSPEKSDKVSTVVQEEVDGGREGLSGQTKDYYQARKDGMRDKDTAEHLGAQPEFFDSSAAVADATFLGKDGSVYANENSDGSIDTYDESDGSTSHTNADKSQVCYDKDGKLTSATHPDGDSVSMEYGKDGELSKVKLPDEGSWDKSKDGTWERKDKDGTVVDKVDKIDVTKDGDLMLHDEKIGETRVAHLDGSHTVINKDQSQMTTDAEGKVVSATHPDGATAKMKYDENGELNKVELPGNTSWQKSADGTWDRKDANGKVVDHVDTIAVDDDGAVMLHDSKNGETRVAHLDGSHTLINKDQSQITKDAEGKVVSATHPDGETAKMEYDENGQLNKVNLPDESSWQKAADGTWDRKDKDGKVVDHVDTIAANDDGAVMLHDSKNGETRVSHLDGSHTLINKDQSQMTRNADGKVVSLTHPDGKTATVEYDEDGHEKKVNLPDGGNWEKKDDNHWTRTDKDGKVLDELNGTISVSDGGAIVLDDEKKKSSEISHLDGSNSSVESSE